MPLTFTAAHSSAIRKQKSDRPLSVLRRSSSSPFAGYTRRKASLPVKATKPSSSSSSSKAGTNKTPGNGLDEFEWPHDESAIALNVTASLDHPSITNVPEAIHHIRAHMFDELPEQRAGMDSTRIAQVLNFQRNLPPIVSVAHLHAVIDQPATVVEREVAELVGKGVVLRVVIPRQGKGWQGVG